MMALRLEQIKKVLSSKYQVWIAAGKKALAGKSYQFACGARTQVSKSLVEILAIPSGLGIKVLRHRFGEPI